MYFVAFGIALAGTAAAIEKSPVLGLSPTLGRILDDGELPTLHQIIKILT